MIEEELRAALAAQLDGLSPRQAAGAVERLMSHYRGRTRSGTPLLRDAADAAAYAAYRMPATFGAVAAALGELAARVPGWVPADHLDVGGGTGAAVWGAAAVWGESSGTPEPRSTRVLDWAGPALELGGRLAADSRSGAVRGAEWRRGEVPGERLPDAQLVTVSYVLGELSDGDRAAVVDAAAGAGRAVVLVEPGTPDGYLRIIDARDRLVAAGLRVVAPCPHSGRCPLVPGEDWCHFGVRVPRSSIHRRVKGGELPYEDEKFSYVAAVVPELAEEPGPARIIRRPQFPKGQVLLDLCTPEDGARRTTVTKRHGDAYRAARRASWGDAWPYR
ncbi:small ribosomal subunit Rsm22 family protein [Streptomyces sulphureus]|uniref:small ribosomal subunit Rsm22 family protein n=1 Tax=Streptomyces sulphureus TaxID=47758 RepID=UPI00035ECDF6|nr:small ribosomal subunit Rsm22 family protein [Streptomyces sulphureus]